MVALAVATMKLPLLEERGGVMMVGERLVKVVRMAAVAGAFRFCQFSRNFRPIGIIVIELAVVDFEVVTEFGFERFEVIFHVV